MKAVATAQLTSVPTRLLLDQSSRALAVGAYVCREDLGAKWHRSVLSRMSARRYGSMAEPLPRHGPFLCVEILIHIHRT